MQLISQPTTWLLFGVMPVVWLFASLSRHDPLSIPRWGWIGLGIYLVSAVSLDFWRFGSTVEQQVAWWQAGIALLGALYGYLACYRLKLAHPVWLHGFAIWWLVVAMFTGDYGVESQKLGEFTLLCWVLAFTLCLWLYLRRSISFFVVFIWTVLLFYELTSPILYLDCQILHGFSDPRHMGSACDRYYETPVSAISFVVTLAAVAYLCLRQAVIWYANRKG